MQEFDLSKINTCMLSNREGTIKLFCINDEDKYTFIELKDLLSMTEEKTGKQIMSISMLPFSIQTCTSQELMQEFHNLINCTQKRYPELLQKMETEIMKRTESKWLSV